jgi:hypothetical protein
MAKFESSIYTYGNPERGLQLIISNPEQSKIFGVVPQSAMPWALMGLLWITIYVVSDPK